MIRLEGICKSFGSSLVLEELNIQVARGEVVCLHGPSGVGKTTILDVVAGLESFDSGQRTIGASRIGYAFQDDRLVPWVSVQENLEIILRSDLDHSDSREQAAEWLAEFGLADYREKLCSELSGGMKRRLNIARSLAVNPDLLLLDEPLAFQDKSYREKLLGLFEGLNKEKGCTIVLVEHQPEAAAQIGARLIPVLEKPPRLPV